MFRVYKTDDIQYIRYLFDSLMTRVLLIRLKLLNVFEPCTLQVGDRNVYVLKATDEITTKEQWRKEQKRLILKDHTNQFRMKRKRTGDLTCTVQLLQMDALGFGHWISC